ncbi:hypothetical protein ACFLSA_00945 [Bacteroidota bacterium]
MDTENWIYLVLIIIALTASALRKKRKPAFEEEIENQDSSQQEVEFEGVHGEEKDMEDFDNHRPYQTVEDYGFDYEVEESVKEGMEIDEPVDEHDLKKESLDQTDSHEEIKDERIKISRRHKKNGLKFNLKRAVIYSEILNRKY